MSTVYQQLEDRVARYDQTQRQIVLEALEEKRNLTDKEIDDFLGLEDKSSRARKQLAEARRNMAANDLRPADSVNASPVRGQVFGSLGEQMAAVARAAVPGGQVDPRLHKVQELAPSGMSEAVPSDGGFLLESEFSTEILRRAYLNGELARRCRKFPIGPNSNALKLPFVDETSRATGSRWGGVRVYRANEADTVTATKPKLGKLEIRLEKLMGLSYCTDELLQDSTQLGQFLLDAFSEEIAFTLDDEIINGDGVAKCLGILNSSALVTVSKESGQAADTIVAANIIKMWARMWARSRRSAVWLVSQDAESQLYSMSFTIGDGGVPVFLPGGGLSDSPFSTLFGRPIVPLEQCSALGDVGDIILADPSQYLLIDKQLNFASSMHVRFIHDEMTFRITYRVNGQPAWKTALTPKNGASTVSPFVTLEAR